MAFLKIIHLPILGGRWHDEASFKPIDHIMKLELLRYVFNEIKKELGTTWNYRLYYFHDEKWTVLGESFEVDVKEAEILNKAQIEPISYRPRGTFISWFGMPELSAVISIEFNGSLAVAKTQAYRTRLNLAKERGEYLFRISHNPLTLLVAKDAFHESLSAALSVSGGLLESDSDEQENTQSQLLAVLALDIDYFKQINDTHGHLYGDQVLKIFGRRLEDVANNIIAVGLGRVQVVVGHPSGEEFLIYIVGTCSREEIASWAEQFRAKIADEILPSQNEWLALSSKADLSMIRLPPQQERNVRASVGVCFRTGANSLDPGGDEAKFLLERADTALYRAKAAGRNQVVIFDNILSSCGRVLEQDGNTRIVALDIGSNVGVSRGQEFKVYSPTFSGATKFLLNDGRTTRTLGTYPRVELTRVTVFDVQAEISFAFTSQIEDKVIEIPKGSHLEAIPVGSIGHIVPYTTKYFVSAAATPSRQDVSSLKEFIKEEAKKKIFCVVFRFANEQEYLRKYGSAALNISLTHLYRLVLSEMRFSSRIAVLDTSSVGVVGAEQVYQEELLGTIVDKFYVDFPELGLVAGTFSNEDIDQVGTYESSLNPDNAVEFAQFAASQYGREIGAKVTHFSYKVARRLLKSQREARAFISAQADFEKLMILGVVSPLILNEGGLIYSTLGLKDLAVDQYEAAAALDQDMPIYRSNLAVMLEFSGDNERPLKIFDAMSDEEVSRIIKLHPLGALVYTLLLIKVKGGKNKNHLDEKRFKLLLNSVSAYDEEFKAKRRADYQIINEMIDSAQA